MLKKGFTDSLALIILVDGQALDLSEISPDRLKGATADDLRVELTNAEISDPLIEKSQRTVQHVPSLSVVVYQLGHGGDIKSSGWVYLHSSERAKMGQIDVLKT